MKTNTNTRILKKTNVVGEAVKPFDSREPSWLPRDQIHHTPARGDTHNKHTIIIKGIHTQIQVQIEIHIQIQIQIQIKIQYHQVFLRYTARSDPDSRWITTNGDPFSPQANVSIGAKSEE